MGQKGAAGGPADDDLLFGEDVLFGEEGDLLGRISEPAGQAADEEDDLAPRGNDEGRRRVRCLNIGVGEQAPQPLPRAGVGEEDIVEVALLLPFLQILDEEGDAVIETRDGLEGESKGLPASRRAEVQERRGLLLDLGPERGREQRLGREREDARFEVFGVMVVEQGQRLLPVLLDLVRILEDEEGVGQEIGEGNEMVAGRQRGVAEAREELAGLDQLDLGFQVAGGRAGRARRLSQTS
jgi:hypothetical protein